MARLNRILGLLAFLVTFLALPSAAMADPASMVIAALASSGITVGVVGAALIRIGVGLALSYASAALRKQQEAEHPGIQTKTTTQGGSLSQTRILGRYATAGNIMFPAYSAGESDSIENAWRYFAVDLADYRITALDAVWVNGKKFTDANLQGTWGSTHGKFPTNIAEHDRWIETIDGTDYYQLYMRFFDGSQTTADSFMVTTFGGRTRRPYTSAMVGQEIPMVRYRLRFDPELYQGNPSLMHEIRGEAVYNPRLDSTQVGSGTGAQRLANRATYVYDDNLIVLAYNVAVGLWTVEGARWGVGYEQADMPYASWSQAIAHASTTVGYGLRYRGGYEIRTGNPETGGEAPWDVMDKLLRGASAIVADCGGELIVRCGPPGANVFSITDQDVLQEEETKFTIHEGITSVFNCGSVSHPHPGQLWEESEAPFYTDTASQTQDGGPLAMDLSLPVVWHRPQAKKVLRDAIKDSRRFRRHIITLPWDFSGLLPLDAIAWTSARHGYTAKKFEVWTAAINPANLCITLSIRERDPSDYTDTDTDDALGDDGRNIATKPPLPGWSVSQVTVEDKDGEGRDPGVRLHWSKRLESKRVQYQGRRVGNTNIRFKGTVENDGDGVLDVTSRVHPDTDYEFRGRGRSPQTGWTPWTPVHTQDVRIRTKDLGSEIVVRRRRFHREGALRTPAPQVAKLLADIDIPCDPENHTLFEISSNIQVNPTGTGQNRSWEALVWMSLWVSGPSTGNVNTLIRSWRIKNKPNDVEPDERTRRFDDTERRSGKHLYQLLLWRDSSAGGSMDFKDTLFTATQFRR